MNESESILICRCVHREIIPAAATRQILEGLASAGRRVTVVDDLCGRAVGNDPLLTSLAATSKPIVLACHPRAVRWLFHAAGIAPLPSTLCLLNLRTQTADAILTQLGLPSYVPQASPLPPITNNPEPLTPPPAPKPWVPWFPVIDYDRCVQCRQCVSFCPFGVYTVQKDRVTVTTPRNCKDNCPACARMCPRQAIIFPKVHEAPIDGSEVSDAVLESTRQRLDAQKRDLAGGDIHAVLAKRKLRMKARV